MKVYAVSSGSYSDYHIDVIFATKALAEEFIEKENADRGYFDEYRLEVWEVEDKYPTKIAVHHIERSAHYTFDTVHEKPVTRRVQIDFPWRMYFPIKKAKYERDKRKVPMWERAYGTDKEAVEALWEEKRIK